MLNSRLRAVALLVVLWSATAANAETGAAVTGQTTFEALDWRSLYISPYFEVPQLSLSVQAHGESDADNLRYEPNVRPVVGLSLEYGPLALSTSQPVPGSASEEAKGATRYRDYKFSFFRDLWGVDLGWHEYSGFYRSLDKDGGDGSDKVDRYEHRGDLRKVGRYANAYWIPRGENVGLGRRLDAETLGEHGWSPVVQLGYDQVHLISERPLVTGVALQQYGQNAALTNATFESYIGAAGLAGAYAHDGWRVTGMMLFGRSLQSRTMSLGGQEAAQSRAWAAGERLTMRAGAEYLWREWLYGFSLMHDETALELGDARIKSEVGTALFSAGTTLGKIARVAAKPAG